MNDNSKLWKNSSKNNFFPEGLINTRLKNLSAVRITWLCVWSLFFIYLFPCCTGVFREGWLANMLSAWFTRKFIYFCSSIHFSFTYYLLLRTMGVCSKFKCEDVLVLINQVSWLNWSAYKSGFYLGFFECFFRGVKGKHSCKITKKTSYKMRSSLNDSNILCP